MIIYILKDCGIVSRGADYLKLALTTALQNWGYTIAFVSAEQIRQGALSNPDRVAMLFISGGRFSEAKATLGKTGIENIQGFIKSGGGYCGICMGAYGAFTNIDFKGKDPKKGQGLGIFNTTVNGNLTITPPYDGTANTATIIDLYHTQYGIHAPSLYWGGFDIERREVETLGAKPLSSFIMPNGEEKILSFKLDRKAEGNPIFLSGHHFEAFTHRMIWDWVSPEFMNNDNRKRLEKEITSYSNGSYLMSLACALDEMQLVPHHSFARDIWPDLQAPRQVPVPDHGIPLFNPRLIFNT